MGTRVCGVGSPFTVSGVSGPAAQAVPGPTAGGREPLDETSVFIFSASQAAILGFPLAGEPIKSTQGKLWILWA